MQCQYWRRIWWEFLIIISQAPCRVSVPWWLMVVWKRDIHHCRCMRYFWTKDDEGTYHVVPLLPPHPWDGGWFFHPTSLENRGTSRRDLHSIQKWVAPSFGENAGNNFQRSWNSKIQWIRKVSYWQCSIILSWIINLMKVALISPEDDLTRRMFARLLDLLSRIGQGKHLPRGDYKEFLRIVSVNKNDGYNNEQCIKWNVNINYLTAYAGHI